MQHSIYNHVRRPGEDKYYYHVEDGQFSFDLAEGNLLGKEGQLIEVDGRNIYILCIEGKHVECIGDVERVFPKTALEHANLKCNFLECLEID